MNIQSISIVPETVGCNARCKYCIAAMTPPVLENDRISLDRLKGQPSLCQKRRRNIDSKLEIHG
ncbi:MAG: hypothetical protein ACLFQV_00110 [Vulcanimicrobiota bacterium]